MTLNEAKEILLDSEKSYNEKYKAAAAMIASKDALPADLLICLEHDGLIAEMAATKLYTLTSRPHGDDPSGIAVDRADWEAYLEKNSKP